MDEILENTRDSIIIYRSFIEAGQSIKNKVERLNFYEAIFSFGLEQKENTLTGTAKGMFLLVKPQLLANQKRYENGKKGGVKPKQITIKTEPKPNQDETKTEPNKNVECSNDNDNANENLKENENDIITETEVSEHEKPLFKIFVEIWFNFHFQKYEFKPAFKAIDGKKINSIIKKLNTVSTDRGFEFTDNVAEHAFLKFLTLAYSDDWLKANFELSNLDSKFNSIIQKSTTGGKKQQNTSQYTNGRTPFDGISQQ